jgi:hypothetical protein
LKVDGIETTSVPEITDHVIFKFKMSIDVTERTPKLTNMPTRVSMKELRMEAISKLTIEDLKRSEYSPY